jgi:hypothetical protein
MDFGDTKDWTAAQKIITIVLIIILAGIWGIFLSPDVLTATLGGMAIGAVVIVILSLAFKSLNKNAGA